jgi:hypothetical protein
MSGVRRGGSVIRPWWTGAGGPHVSGLPTLVGLLTLPVKLARRSDESAPERNNECYQRAIMPSSNWAFERA